MRGVGEGGGGAGRREREGEGGGGGGGGGEPNIVEITHLCIMHWVHTSFLKVFYFDFVEFSLTKLFNI